MQIEEKRRSEDRDDDPACVAEEQPRDDSTHERAGEPEPDRGEDAHRVRARERKACERAHDQPAEGKDEDEPENHRYLRLSRRRVREAVYSASSRTPESWSSSSNPR